MYDIKTIDDLVDALGGDTALAAELGVSQPAVANWKARGEIPGGWHMRLMAKLVARGLTVDTLSVFGLPDAEALTINRLLAGNAQNAVAA